MKNNIVCILFVFYIFSNLSYSLPAKAIKSKLNKKGYVASKEKILKKVLDLSESESGLLSKMVCNGRDMLFSGGVHNGERSFRTGVVVIHREDKEKMYFIPEKSSSVNDGSGNLSNVNHSEEEGRLIKKIGERIAKIVKGSAFVVDIHLFKDESEKKQELSWHQDRFDGISDPDLLLFSVLDKQDSTENKASQGVQRNYIRIGSIGKDLLYGFGGVGYYCVDEVKKVKKIEDKSGAGYFIDQRYRKNKKLLVHSRDKRNYPSVRSSMVVRVTTLDDKSSDMFIGSGEDSYETGFKRIYLSDPEIAKALFEKYCENNDLDKSQLEKSIEDKEDAQSYYKLMARVSEARDGV